MPNAENSIALQIDAIERHNFQRSRTRPDGSAEVAPNTGATHAEVAWLISTLRRQMAINVATRGRLDHLCKAVEKAHAAARGFSTDGKGPELRRPPEPVPCVVDEP